MTLQKILLFTLIIITLSAQSIEANAKNLKLVHASFDVTREIFREINQAFKEQYPNVTINQSHNGSGKQTIALLNGLKADIISLALPYQLDLLADHQIIDKNWRQIFSNNSSPIQTNIVFLVRKNNPLNIKNWDDLLQKNIKIITANPKTSGGAIWVYVAAFIYAQKHYQNDQDKISLFLKKLYQNVPILSSSSRGAAANFVNRGLGDVLITWASDAYYIINHIDPGYQIIDPSITILVKIPVVASSKSKNNIMAKHYIDFLYSPDGQNIVKKYYYDTRLINKNTTVIDPDAYFDWSEFKAKHLAKDGFFDKIFK